MGERKGVGELKGVCVSTVPPPRRQQRQFLPTHAIPAFDHSSPFANPALPTLHSSTAAASAASVSPRMATCWRLARVTRRRGCGIWKAASVSSRSRATSQGLTLCGERRPFRHTAMGHVIAKPPSLTDRRHG
eukprot:364870-Chlamydomonas_euryale.AAC.17